MAGTETREAVGTEAHPGAPVKLSRPETTLRDKYVLEQGTIFLSGIQALVRVLLDQNREDVRRGLKTKTFVSGYQGSPLGGFDKELMRLGDLADVEKVMGEHLGQLERTWESENARPLVRPLPQFLLSSDS